jgi:GT2 family glycosyltransferase
VLFLDDDILPARTLLEQHLRWHERHPEETVGVLGRVQWAHDVRVTPFMRWLDRGIQFDYGGIRGTEAAWWNLYSCNASLKRSALEHTGGFDEVGFPFGYEDLDLGRRLSDHGFRLLYNRDARAEHLRTDSLESFCSRIPRIAQAEAAFVARWPEATPYFRDLFAAALSREPARGRAARFAAVVPPWIPWLGPRVWASADARFKQALAPAYKRAWAEASQATGG